MPNKLNKHWANLIGKRWCGEVNRTKKKSQADGRTYLRDAFAAEQSLLLKGLELSEQSITHDGVMGDVNEQHFIETLRRYLPNRYEVSSGIVIDSKGSTSDQIDVVIFDPQYTPTLLVQHSHRFIPAEAVYCVLEVKPTMNKKLLDYAGEKAESVRRLVRTSVPIPHAGGEYKAKRHFEIIAGIVAVRNEWKEGCLGNPFKRALNAQRDLRKLNCGLALRERAFDTYSGELITSRSDGSLAQFIFRLLQQLQSLGTVPAVDWNTYGAILGGPVAIQAGTRGARRPGKQ